jgi:hypothetical protein
MTAMNPLDFKPDSFYHECDLIVQYNLSEFTLARVRKSGALRFKELARGKRLYLGQWLIDWLSRPEGG